MFVNKLEGNGDKMDNVNDGAYSIVTYKKATKLIEEGHSINAISRLLNLGMHSAMEIFNVYQRWREEHKVKVDEIKRSKFNEFADFELNY